MPKKKSLLDEAKRVLFKKLLMALSAKNPGVEKRQIVELCSKVTNENERVTTLLVNLSARIQHFRAGKYTLTPIAQTVLTRDICESVNVDALIAHYDSLIETARLDLDNLDDHAPIEALGESITEAFNEKSQELIPRDKRIHHSDEKRLRRFDSLSRLLAMNTSNSACAAVSILNGELYISANSSGELSSDEMYETLKRKLALIKEFINEVLEEKKSLSDETLSDCVKVLRGLSGGLASARLKQDLIKLIDACRLTEGRAEEEGFSASERHALLGEDARVSILLPLAKIRKVPSDIRPQRLIVKQVGGVKVSTDAIPFEEGFPDNAVICELHAEQMIMLHFQKELGEDLWDQSEATIRVGISKLCCQTCHEVMSVLDRVSVRGEHQIGYEGTLNLMTYKALIKPKHGLNLEEFCLGGETQAVNSRPTSPLWGVGGGDEAETSFDPWTPAQLEYFNDALHRVPDRQGEELSSTDPVLEEGAPKVVRDPSRVGGSHHFFSPLTLKSKRSDASKPPLSEKKELDDYKPSVPGGLGPKGDE